MPDTNKDGLIGGKLVSSKDHDRIMRQKKMQAAKRPAKVEAPKDPSDEEKEALIAKIKELGGTADKRSSVETLQEKLAELESSGD